MVTFEEIIKELEDYVNHPDVTPEDIERLRHKIEQLMNIYNR